MKNKDMVLDSDPAKSKVTWEMETVEDYLDDVAEYFEKKYDVDEPVVINFSTEAREHNGEDTIRVIRKLLQIISKETGSKLEVTIDNNHNPYNIYSVTIEHYSENEYNYVIDTREYKKDYSFYGMADFEEMMDILILAIIAGKNLRFILDYDKKRNEMKQFANLLLKSGVEIEFESEPILLTKQIKYDRFITDFVPKLAYLDIGGWLSVELNYTWDHHPYFLDYASVEITPKGNIDFYIETFKDFRTFKRYKKTLHSKQEAIDIFWKLLIREELPNLDEWDDITSQKRKKEE